MGRVKSANKFGPRVIDLDIVVWNGEVTDEDYYSREFLRDAVEEVIEGKKGFLRRLGGAGRRDIIEEQGICGLGVKLQLNRD